VNGRSTSSSTWNETHTCSPRPSTSRTPDRTARPHDLNTIARA
jgi:hypothetical protein